MTMLSRVAERLFWMARYLERAEDTARLTSAYTHLIMDIPEGTELGWDVLIHIMDADPLFQSRPRGYNEQSVLKFLIAEDENASSIRNAVRMARENVRTTRDVLPEETWEQVNELYLYTQEMAEKSVGRRNRYEFLEQVSSRCQMINGMLMTTLCRDHAYRFIKLGHLLERADMTTRVIDVGAGAIWEREGVNAALNPLLLSSLLQALSAMGTFRRMTGPLVEAPPVVNFVFKESSLPRSVQYCLRGIREELKPLANSAEAVKLVDRSLRKLNRFDAEKNDWQKIHRFIDDFQSGLIDINNAITDTWFQPEMQ